MFPSNRMGRNVVYSKRPLLNFLPPSSNLNKILQTFYYTDHQLACLVTWDKCWLSLPVSSNINMTRYIHTHTYIYQTHTYIYLSHTQMFSGMPKYLLIRSIAKISWGKQKSRFIAIPILGVLQSSPGTLWKQSWRNVVKYVAINPIKTSWIYHWIRNIAYTFFFCSLYTDRWHLHGVILSTVAHNKVKYKYAVPTVKYISVSLLS